jgi:hypothetical protein
LHPFIGSAKEKPGAENIGADFSQRSSRRYQYSNRRISPSPKMNIVSIL